MDSKKYFCWWKTSLYIIFSTFLWHFNQMGGAAKTTLEAWRHQPQSWLKSNHVFSNAHLTWPLLYLTFWYSYNKVVHVFWRKSARESPPKESIIHWELLKQQCNANKRGNEWEGMFFKKGKTVGQDPYLNAILRGEILQYVYSVP